jgi:hypothetical protein
LRQKLLIGVLARLQANSAAKGLGCAHQVFKVLKFASLVVVCDCQKTGSFQEKVFVIAVLQATIFKLCSQVFHLSFK